MSYQLDFSDTATKDIKSFRKSGDKILLKKLNRLLVEIIEQPPLPRDFISWLTEAQLLSSKNTNILQSKH